MGKGDTDVDVVLGHAGFDLILGHFHGVNHDAGIAGAELFQQ